MELLVYYTKRPKKRSYKLVSLDLTYDKLLTLESVKVSVKTFFYVQIIAM